MNTLTIIDRDHIVDALNEEWDSLVALAAELAPWDWDHPTDCPGWSVKDCYAHILGTESMLLGRPNPTVELPAELPHVRNEIGRANEEWVVAYRDRSGAEVLGDLAEVITERRSVLAKSDQEAFDQPSWTPAGEDSYGRFMRIRVMDQWMHEQDVREAVGRPGHLEGVAAEVTLDELAAALGYVVGKKAAAPAGSTVRFDLKGPMSDTLDIVVSDRARLVDQLSGEPSVTITLPGATFCRLAGGRRNWDHPWVRAAVSISGDEELGRRILSNLAFTI
ncbi:MAG TPA: maleylpyruvate isomerase family mycothiol-dependent enzyme [Acidimicrobiales bacterium]